MKCIQLQLNGQIGIDAYTEISLGLQQHVSIPLLKNIVHLNSGPVSGLHLYMRGPGQHLQVVQPTNITCISHVQSNHDIVHIHCTCICICNSCLMVFRMSILVRTVR